MKKKVILLIISILIILFALLGFFTFKSRTIVPSGVIKCYFHLYSPTVKESFNTLLDEFESFYPEITLVRVIEPYQDMKKTLSDDMKTVSDPTSPTIAVLTGQDVNDIFGKSPTSSPWISYTWELYYNTEALSELGYNEESIQSFSTAGFEEFLKEFSPLSKTDRPLFSLGADYYWPWLVWVQHLELLLHNGKNPQGVTPEDWSEGIAYMEFLFDSNLFNSDFRTRNFAWSQLAVNSGESLFVLSDSNIYRNIPPRERDFLGSVPFPGSVGQKWVVGSNFYLEAYASEEVSPNTLAAGDLLLDYLRSEGIRQRFLKQTGIRFLPDQGQRERKDIPSIAHRTIETEMQELLKYLDQKP